AGRSGRREEQGKVLIQTYAPDHRVIAQVVGHDYEGMFTAEINERKSFDYPPFYRLIRIDVRHKEQHISQTGSERLAWLLRPQLERRVLGPEQPLISRVRNLYIQRILLKIERQGGISIGKVKELIRQTISHFVTEKHYKSVRVQVDV